MLLCTCHKERVFSVKLTSYALDPAAYIADTLGQKLGFLADVKFGSSSEVCFIFIVGFLLPEKAQTGRSL